MRTEQTILPRVDLDELNKIDLNKRQDTLAKYLRIHPFTPNFVLGPIFGVTAETIRKDKITITSAGMTWGDDLATGGFMVECASKLSIMEELIQQEYGEFKLQQRKGKIDPNTKNRLFRFCREKLETINDVPLYHKYMKWEIKMKEEGLG